MYNVLVKDIEMYPSAIFQDDETYELHVRNTISVLEKCILRGEDVTVEAPMATRVLLDFYEETLRRHLIWQSEKEKK